MRLPVLYDYKSIFSDFEPMLESKHHFLQKQAPLPPSTSSTSMAYDGKIDEIHLVLAIEFDLRVVRQALEFVILQRRLLAREEKDWIDINNSQTKMCCICLFLSYTDLIRSSYPVMYKFVTKGEVEITFSYSQRGY